MDRDKGGMDMYVYTMCQIINAWIMYMYLDRIFLELLSSLQWLSEREGVQYDSKNDFIAMCIINNS